jgi:hypothetical protein
MHRNLWPLAKRSYSGFATKNRRLNRNGGVRLKLQRDDITVASQCHTAEIYQRDKNLSFTTKGFYKKDSCRAG